ncbi:MAG: hypothetical protein ACLF0G_01935 [Candidatus Brocadiia bacterium]
MARLAKTIGRWGFPLLLLLTVSCAVRAGAQDADRAGERPPQAASEPASPASPQEQAASSLLDRYRRDWAIRQQQRRHEAERELAAAREAYQLKEWQEARRHLESCLQLEPRNAEARELLRKTLALLGLDEGRVGSVLEHYRRQHAIAVQVQITEIKNLFARAKRLYRQEQYREALDLFHQVIAKAQAVYPYIDASGYAEDSEVFIRKARQAAETGRQRESKARREQAIQQAVGPRPQAAAEQAPALLAEKPRRPLLLRRPREAATERHWRTVGTWTVPQAPLVYMPPGGLRALRHRPSHLLGEETKPQPEWEAALREALERRVSFDFVDTPLSDVASFLSTLAEVTIVLDNEALGQQEPRVTLRVRDMRLGAALDWVSRLAGLTYGLKDEAIFISSPGRFADETVLKLYDVTDLTLEIPNFKGNQRALATDLGWGPEQQTEQELLRDIFPDEPERQEPSDGGAVTDLVRQLLPPGQRNDEDARQLLGEPVFAIKSHNAQRQSGEALVDIIGLTIGGQSWIGATSRE